MPSPSTRLSLSLSLSLILLLGWHPTVTTLSLSLSLITARCPLHFLSAVVAQALNARRRAFGGSLFSARSPRRVASLAAGSAEQQTPTRACADLLHMHQLQAGRPMQALPLGGGDARAAAPDRGGGLRSGGPTGARERGLGLGVTLVLASEIRVRSVGAATINPRILTLGWG